MSKSMDAETRAKLVTEYLQTRGGKRDLDPAVVKIARANKVEIGASDCGFPLLTTRALAGDVSLSAGGALVQHGLVDALEISLRESSIVRRLATIYTTDKGGGSAIATLDDTTVEGEILAEGEASTLADLTFGARPLLPRRFSSKRVRCSAELMADASPVWQASTGRILDERIARRQNRAFTTGTGTNEPYGITFAATVGKTTASASAVTWDEVFDLVASVDSSYFASPSCGLMMSQATWLYLRKVKDSGGGYIWSTDPVFSKLPIFLNPNMPAMGAGAKPIAFGDFSRYAIRDVRDLRLVINAEAEAVNDIVQLSANMRSDGNLADVNAIKTLQMAAI